MASSTVAITRSLFSLRLVMALSLCTQPARARAPTQWDGPSLCPWLAQNQELFYIAGHNICFQVYRISGLAASEISILLRVAHQGAGEGVLGRSTTVRLAPSTAMKPFLTT